MSQLTELYQHAFQQWESWLLTDYSEKRQCIEKLIAALPADLAGIANYQLGSAQTLVADAQFMVSPTGETNELYTQGRGVSWLMVDSDKPNADQAAVAMLVTALIAGNSVIMTGANTLVCKQLLSACEKAALPSHLVQLASVEDMQQGLSLDIGSAVYIGDGQKVTELNPVLAAKTSAITRLVAETDLDSLPVSLDPMLVLNFITERVRTINITAIGGNAMLLELGGEGH